MSASWVLGFGFVFSSGSPSRAFVSLIARRGELGQLKQNLIHLGRKGTARLSCCEIDMLISGWQRAGK